MDLFCYCIYLFIYLLYVCLCVCIYKEKMQQLDVYIFNCVLQFDCHDALGTSVDHHHVS